MDTIYRRSSKEFLHEELPKSMAALNEDWHNVGIFHNVINRLIRKIQLYGVQMYVSSTWRQIHLLELHIVKWFCKNSRNSQIVEHTLNKTYIDCLL